MKIYGWQTFVSGAPRNGGQVRAICAARSMAEVARRAGERNPRALFNLGDTGNEREIALVAAHPDAILVRPINDWNAPYRVWTKGAAWHEMPEVKP